MLDIEFYGKKLWRLSTRSRSEKAVVDTWHQYLDHLNTNFDPGNEVARDQWLIRGDDLLTDLLYEMSKAVGYDFDKV